MPFQSTLCNWSDGARKDVSGFDEYAQMQEIYNFRELTFIGTKTLFFGSHQHMFPTVCVCVCVCDSEHERSQQNSIDMLAWGLTRICMHKSFALVDALQ